MANVTKLLYDCRVFLCPYNRQPIKKILYQDVYYEINQGLSSVSVTLNREGAGTASISLFLPIQNQMMKSVLLKYDKQITNQTTIITSEQYISEKDKLLKTHTSAETDTILKRSYLKLADGRFAKITDVTPDKAATTDLVVNEVGKAWGSLNDYAIDNNVPSLTRPELLQDKWKTPINVDYAPLLNDSFTECFFAPMDKIKIYMSKRFQGKSIDDENIDAIDPKTGYVQTFEGLINRVDINYANGNIDVTISAKDATRWLELSDFNVNPAVAGNIMDSIYPNMGISAFSTTFAGWDLKDIIRVLILGTTDDYIDITKEQYDNANKEFTKKGESRESFDAQFRQVDFDETFYLWDNIYETLRTNTLARLETRLGFKLNAVFLSKYNIASRSDVTLSDVDAMIIGEGLTAQRNQIMPSTSEIEQQKATKNTTLSNTKYQVKAPAYRAAGNFRLLDKNQGITPGKETGLENIRLETDFTTDKLWIDPDIPNFTPYLKTFNNFELFQHNWQKIIDIIREITAICEFEFFMDSTGVLVCKIPDYNVNPGTIITEAPLSTQDAQYKDLAISQYFKLNDDRYLIKPQEILAYSKAISDDEIATFCTLVGLYEFGLEEVAWGNTDIAYDTELSKNFGVRVIKKDMPLLAGDAASSARQMFAKAWLNRQNAKIKSIEVTIPLRPELQLAKTVAFMTPQDATLKAGRSTSSFDGYVDTFASMEDLSSSDLEQTEVGYISQITHTWAPGDVCTTKLSLSHVRLWTQSFGTLAYTRSNIAEINTLGSSDYQRLESEYGNKILLRTSAYRRYQSFLTTKGFYSGVIDGSTTSVDREAVNKFLKEFNIKYGLNLELFKDGDYSFYEQGYVLDAFIKEGLTG